MKKTPAQPLLAAAVLAAAALALAGPAAQAQVIRLSALPSQPPPAIVSYPMGTSDPNYSNIKFLYGPLTAAAGNSTVTFTATQAAQVSQNGKSFETFTSNGSLDFPVGTELIDTGVGSLAAAGNTATGPLRIDFSVGVSAFGLDAQDNAIDTEQFMFTVFTNGNLTNGTTFVTPAYDNTGGPAGKSVFLGAQALGGSAITSVLIGSRSSNNGVVSLFNSNDIYFGPLSVDAPVPEASTLVSCGLLLGLGGTLVSARKKRESAAPKN